MSRRKPDKRPEGTRPPRTGLASVAVAILAIVSTALVVRNEFAQDDIAIVQESTRLHDFGAWREILTLPYWPPPASPDLYRPVTSFWLTLQYVFGNGQPLLYHVISVLLFAAPAVMVYRLAARQLTPIPAFIAAAVFAV